MGKLAKGFGTPEHNGKTLTVALPLRTRQQIVEMIEHYGSAKTMYVVAIEHLYTNVFGKEFEGQSIQEKIKELGRVWSTSAIVLDVEKFSDQEPVFTLSVNGRKIAANFVGYDNLISGLDSLIYASTLDAQKEAQNGS